MRGFRRGRSARAGAFAATGPCRDRPRERRRIYWTGAGVDGDIDDTPPETSITKRPHRKIERRRAKFRFTAHETGATFECKLDEKAFRACGSPRTYKRLKKGKCRFSVRAADAAGNFDPSPATDRFKVVG